MSTSTAQFVREAAPDGSFRRQPSRFTDRIAADGSSGFPAEPGRYHLYVSLACPWAQRQLIVRELKGLRDAIGVTVVDPIRDERGWAFREGRGHSRDPVNDFDFLAQAYEATDPEYEGRHTVPVIWDTQTDRIVTNEFRVIDVQLATQFDAHATRDVDLYPTDLRDEIDALDEIVYADVNDGVYRAGFATTQEAYDHAFDALFARLDDLDRRLGSRRYLVGRQLTLADIRLYTTLIRFDAVYHDHFRCNLRKITEYPNLWPYLRDLYQRPAFHGTTDFDHIKRHYYVTHTKLNPSGIVPKGPALDLDAPHDRDRLAQNEGS